MKNYLALLILPAFIFLGACKKNYTCTCIASMTGSNVDFELKKKTKSTAEKECKANNGDIAVDGYYNCHLR